ncbi:uncharacterized protein SPAPADRAFT_58388 [Spathaspora passalidarum NRRL Y-27907]|uniref:Exosome complex protein n=1 Tax=Spathaspora passalidarum (strain NRRL Y-27907 / 11-Y1) TaxID=619300 RepID=G3AG53_SPAPN|nr:uncharacterized protein SPAPADRAFT_58388 [Spathaspora passalidarum NRRL Y-27907]EGW35192.1 hypothetical protein SPAPADRAFT_58388 [Spathaspora passalidarum NRRL Y-27907]
MENIDNVRLFVQNLDASITNLEESLVPLLKKSLAELTSTPGQSHTDKIKIYNNYAYVLVSTIYSYLKSIGIDTDSHPIKQELTRVKSYMNRLKSLESGEISEEKQKQAAEEQAKSFLARTLGVKSVGGAIDSKTAGPAISFQGTHTKFEDKEEPKEETIKKVTKEVKPKPKNKSTIKSATKSTSKPTKTKSGKVTKPKTKSKKNV